jgi:hypothetical protein
MENIIFDSTKNLQIALKESATTPCDITVSYVDVNGSGLVVADGAQESRISVTSYQTILSAPTSPNVRNALTVTVVNNDTVQHTFYIYKVLISGPTYYLVTEQIIGAGASWDSNLSNNLFDMAGAINNAGSNITPNTASKIGFWDFASNALRQMKLSELTTWLGTYFGAPSGATQSGHIAGYLDTLGKILVDLGSPLTVLNSAVTPGTSGNVLTSNGSSWTSAAPSGGGGGGGDFAVADGRLTLTSGTPVTTADVIGATNIYYTPYKGTKIGLFDGASTWNIVTFAETSLPLGTLTSGLTYDLFAYNNSGTLALELSAWTNATTRATALVYQNGILVKSSATTRRYLGTFYTTSTTTTEDSASKRFVWNYYNRVERSLYVLDNTVHNYTTAAWRIWNNAAADKAQFILGVIEEPVSTLASSAMGGAVTSYFGIGINSTSAPQVDATTLVTATGYYFLGVVLLTSSLSLGYNYISMMEYGVAGASQTSALLSATIRG